MDSCHPGMGSHKPGFVNNSPCCIRIHNNSWRYREHIYNNLHCTHSMDLLADQFLMPHGHIVGRHRNTDWQIKAARKNAIVTQENDPFI